MKRIVFILLVLSCSTITSLIGQIQAQSKDSAKAKTTDYLIFPHPFEMASYPGGVKAWQNHLRKKIKPLEPSCEEGKIFASFKVLASGKVDSVLIIRGLCELANQNAIEIIKTSGSWSPGLDNGKPVDSKIGIHIVFRHKKK